MDSEYLCKFIVYVYSSHKCINIYLLYKWRKLFNSKSHPTYIIKFITIFHTNSYLTKFRKSHPPNLNKNPKLLFLIHKNTWNWKLTSIFNFKRTHPFFKDLEKGQDRKKNRKSPSKISMVESSRAKNHGQAWSRAKSPLEYFRISWKWRPRKEQEGWKREEKNEKK